MKWVVDEMTHHELERHIKIVEDVFAGQDSQLQSMWIVVFDCFVNRGVNFIRVIRHIIPK